MKPTYEVWLEIVRERMTQGDSAVAAIGKAQLVTNAYAMRFEQKPDLNIKAPQAYLDELLLKREEELKEKYEEGPAFNTCSDAPSDPNTGQS